MKRKIDITDEDIDNLFLNNDTSSLEETEEDKSEKVELPEELSLEKDTKSNHVDRPEDDRSEQAKIKSEIKEKEKETENNIQKDINSVKSLSGLKQARLYIQKLMSLKNDQKIQKEKTKAIVAGNTPTYLDKGTECTFHIYNPKEVLGDKVYCYCRYCSCEKIFTQKEWDDYCLKYRKWF